MQITWGISFRILLWFGFLNTSLILSPNTDQPPPFPAASPLCFRAVAFIWVRSHVDQEVLLRMLDLRGVTYPYPHQYALMPVAATRVSRWSV